jgi:hypothetical protein
MNKLVFYTKNIINYINNYNKNNVVMLGRWKIKNCNDVLTNYNAVYQNRDHCGDSICKLPLKADIYKNK